MNDTMLPGARARWGHWHLFGNACELVQHLQAGEGTALIPGALGGSHLTSLAESKGDRFLFWGERRPDGGFRIARGVGADRGEFYKLGE